MALLGIMIISETHHIVTQSRSKIKILKIQTNLKQRNTNQPPIITHNLTWQTAVLILLKV